jgi:hypothetical protein
MAVLALDAGECGGHFGANFVEIGQVLSEISTVAVAGSGWAAVRRFMSDSG